MRISIARKSPWAVLLTIAALPAMAVPRVSVSPSSPSVRAGLTRQFTATVTELPVTTVKWSVNGIAGGNTTVGTIDATGLYTAPAPIPANNVVSVRASADANPSVFGTAAVTLLNPVPRIDSLTPASFNVGKPFTVTIAGVGLLATSTVKLNGSPVAATYLNPTSMRFSGSSTLPAASTIAVTVTNPDPGAAVSNTRNLTVKPPVSVLITPTSGGVRGGRTIDFNATVKNANNSAVTWSVNGVAGGNTALGAIDANGLYSAPIFVPAEGKVIIAVTSVEDPDAKATATLTVHNPVPLISSITPNPAVHGNATITIHGSRFIPNSTIEVGGKLWTPTWISTGEFRATGPIEPSPGGVVPVVIAVGEPGPAASEVFVLPVGVAQPKVSYKAAVRFLEQTTWGPTPASIARVQELGFDAWLTEQFNQPALSRFALPADNSIFGLQKQFFTGAMTGTDQLRQRVAFTLGQIFVVSAVEVREARALSPYLNMLRDNAFTTYRNLLTNVSLSPTMGDYLDLVNNLKANPAKGTVPNENYPRELLQLFSVGLILLGPDGVPVRDAQGKTIPTYTQTDVENFTRALTGFTYPKGTDSVATDLNPPNYSGLMLRVDKYHDTGSKTLLNGVVLAPNQNARIDLFLVVDNLMKHQNIGPFVALRLIQHHVASNPSPAYVQRVANAFRATDGDIKATVRAMLLDPEARAGDTESAPASAPAASTNPAGHLREPVLHLFAILRALNATIVYEDPIEAWLMDMGQRLLYPASVFNYYSPLYRVSPTLAGPEFQIFNTTTALARTNFVHEVIRTGTGKDAEPDLSPWLRMASNPGALVEMVDQYLFHGSMPLKIKETLLTAARAKNDLAARVRIVLYLALSSGAYQVQH